MLAGAEEVSVPVAVAAVVTTLVLSWGATFVLGGAGTTAPHWFYLPILIAAARFGGRGALLVAILSGLLAGPLMPESVEAGTSQPLSDWLSRAVFFAVIGLVMAMLVTRAQGAAARERMAIAHQRSVIQSVSHEFRTPLTLIRGTVEMLEQEELDPAESEQLMTMLRTATERMTDLVELVIATAESGAPQVRGEVVPIELPALVDEIVDALESFDARERVTVRVGHPALALGRPKLFELCLRAVIENALKFSAPASPVEVDIWADDERVHVVVRDRGPGIDPEVARRSVRTGFASTRATALVGGGLGLGLFTAARAVERLGGTLAIEGDPEGGTRARLSFPSAGNRPARD